MRKFFAVLISIATLMVCGTACDRDSDLEYGSKTYYYNVNGKKVELEVFREKAYISFLPENEEKLKSELSKYNITLTSINRGKDYDDENNQLTDEAYEIFHNYRTAILIGDYLKAKSVLSSLTIGWSPYYLDNKYMTDCEFSLGISLSAKLAKGIDVARLKDFAKKNKVIFGGKYSSYEGWYILIVTNKSRGNALEIANRLMESGFCEHAQSSTIGGDFFGWDDSEILCSNR